MDEVNEPNPAVKESANEGDAAPAHRRQSLWRGMALLLAIAVLMITIGSCSSDCPLLFDCDGNCDDEDAYSSNTTSLVATAPQQSLTVAAVKEPGQAHWGELGFREFSAGLGLEKMTWYPDMAVIDRDVITFSKPPLSGGPPFEWDNLAPAETIRADFRYGAEFSVGGNYIANDLVLGAAIDQGDPNLPTLQDDLALQVGISFNFADALDAQAASPPPGQAVVAPFDAHATTEDPKIWQLSLGIDPQGMALSAAKCQETTELLRSPQAFMAVRLPISATTLSPGAIGYHSPLLFGADSSGVDRSPYLRLFDNGDSLTFTATMELRPQRLSFLQETMPAPEGEAWLALGMAAETPDCPPEAEASSGQWDAFLELNLDLNHMPNTCIGCELPLYICFEGQTWPNTVSGAGGPQAASFAASNITCLGPQRLTLSPSLDDWTLDAPTSTVITPTQVIIFLYGLRSISQPITVAVSLTSTLPVDWALYQNTADQPDLSKPLTPTVTLGVFTTWFWAVASALPEGTPSGPYAISVRAVNQNDLTDDRFVDNTIWVGGWVAPPPKQATTPATFSIGDITVSEGSGEASFTVTLSKLINQNVEVSFATADGTATQPDDYTSTTGTVTIAAGLTTATIKVPIIDDQVTEGSETFSVELSNPVNAAIGDVQGVATIEDNDSAGDSFIYLPKVTRK